MADWVERDAGGARVAEWLHVATGVVVFVEQRNGEYAACIRAPEGASVDSVSIGDPDTGEFERFADRERAVAYTDEWKDDERVLKALEPGE